MIKFFVIAIAAVLVFAFLLLRFFSKGNADVKANDNINSLKSNDNEFEKPNDTSLANLIETKANSQKEDPITLIKAGDKEIERFYDTAQKHLPYLIDFMKENGNDTLFYKYFVKTKFCEGDECEHMWVQVYKYKNNVFTGTVANDPSIIKLTTFGDKIKISSSKVEDWLLIDDLLNVKVGGYSQEYIGSKTY